MNARPGGCSLRLALKAGQCLGVSGDFIWQELEGDEAMQPGVLSLVHYTHPAAAQLLDNAVMRNGLADHVSWPSPVWNEHVRS